MAVDQATPSRRADAAEVGVAELVAALSLASDLGVGQPMEHVLRGCQLAVGFARELGVPGGELRDVYDVALLRRIGHEAYPACFRLADGRPRRVAPRNRQTGRPFRFGPRPAFRPDSALPDRRLTDANIGECLQRESA